jgi:hypothetical protein
MEGIDMDKDVDEDIIDVDVTEEEEDIIEHVPQTQTIHLIAKLLNERGMNAGDAEPLLWMMLSSIYRILRKRHGSSIDDIMHLIDDHKEAVRYEMSSGGVDITLEELL